MNFKRLILGISFCLSFIIVSWKWALISMEKEVPKALAYIKLSQSTQQEKEEE